VHRPPTPCSPEAARYGVDSRSHTKLKEGELRIKLPACKLSQTVTKWRPQLRERLASIVVGSEIEAAPRMFRVLVGDLFEEGGIRGIRRPGAFRLGSLHTIALSRTDASIAVMNARADSLHATGWNSRWTRSRHSLRPALFSIVFRITL
jgi:hypothetical protein